ncbi:unnamed protein product, partial [Amoebophrya sp. A120]
RHAKRGAPVLALSLSRFRWATPSPAFLGPCTLATGRSLAPLARGAPRLRGAGPGGFSRPAGRGQFDRDASREPLRRGTSGAMFAPIILHTPRRLGENVARASGPAKGARL